MGWWRISMRVRYDWRDDHSGAAESLWRDWMRGRQLGTMPTLTTNRFGRDTTGTVGVNWFRTANYRSDKLTDSELEALTA